MTFLENPRRWYIRESGCGCWWIHDGPEEDSPIVANGFHEPIENADLIVRAVNAYEPLVKALRELADIVEPLRLMEYDGVKRAVRNARAALATVESSPEREGGE